MKFHIAGRGAGKTHQMLEKYWATFPTPVILVADRFSKDALTGEGYWGENHGHVNPANVVVVDGPLPRKVRNSDNPIYIDDLHLLLGNLLGVNPDRIKLVNSVGILAEADIPAEETQASAQEKASNG
jgi:hypothetical protein